ncbi:MAG: hypothetical protein GY936_15890, partial [Ignavibacteriae bacterium]|nr:hypothetical protein [Ignavibacteriota bacterium]
MNKIIIIFIFLFANLSAQSIVNDSLKTRFPNDSTFTKSLSERIDTTKNKAFDVDAIVFSSAADSLHFNLNSKKMF